MKNQSEIFHGGRASGKMARQKAISEILFKNGFKVAFISDRPPLGELKGDNLDSFWANYVNL
ncbi:MAG: hypothetical protein MUF12_06870 [Sediminibacterium sp.]|jgi:hypothetical protein|nr:hypothetical protein [Sediminibacterium sp.]